MTSPSSPARVGHDRVGTFLERFDVRVALSLAILASLVPHRFEATTDLVFLGLFSLELALRIAALLARRQAASAAPTRTTTQRVRAALLLALDVVALATFVPFFADAIGDVGWLRLLRFARLLLLLAYWSPLFRAGVEVLGRQDRWRQIGVLALVSLLVAFAGAALLVHISVTSVDFDGSGVVDDADHGFGARFWWSFRQIAESGNNLITDPNEIVVVVASMTPTLAGLVFVSFLIGLATDIVRELVIEAGSRAPGWRGHTVVVHTTPGLPRLLEELGAYYERLFRRPRFIVADPLPEPPDGFRRATLPRFRWRSIDARGTELADKTDLARARRVVVLARPEAPFPDAHLAAMVLNVRDANAQAWIVGEVLDPCNVRATSVAGGGRTVVVPTEQLLALWALAAVRRPDQLAIAHELVVSRTGREIYTCYLDADGLDGPDGAGSAWHAGTTTFGEVLALALERGGRVMPLGIVRGDAAGGAPEVGELVLNPAPDQPLAGTLHHPIRALVAIADHFDDLRDLTRDLVGGARAATRLTPAPTAPELAPLMAPQSHRRVLVCGFRPATVTLCAALLDGDPDCELTLVQRHEESVRSACQALLEHGITTRATPREADGRFEPLDDTTFAWVHDDDASTPRARLTIVRADWSSDRTLRGLEPGIAHVAAYDLVVLLGAHHPEYDGRTAMAVLKVADLVRAEAARFAPDFTIVAGIADVELGHRLREGFARASGRVLHVIDTEELRALMVFQSIAVPGYFGLFTELVGPGAQGFVRFTITRGAPDRAWTFALLAATLVTRRVLLIAVDLRDGRQVHRSEEAFTEADIVGLWTLHDEAVTGVGEA